MEAVNKTNEVLPPKTGSLVSQLSLESYQYIRICLYVSNMLPPAIPLGLSEFTYFM